MRRISPELRRFLLIWILPSLVVTPVVALLCAYLFWPGTQSDMSAGQVTDYAVGFAIGTPILLLVLNFLVYSIVRFRQKGDVIEEGPRIFFHQGLAMTWILLTVAIALGAVVYDCVRILKPGAAGSGQGPTALSPLHPVSAGGTSLSEKPLKVQVIGQQWAFTYRYPAYGVETPHLDLPQGQTVEFHVTSLDVIHSFWAYGLGVKADAVPGSDNIAYATPRTLGPFQIRCDELCGIWHGYMFDTGHVATVDGFNRWIRGQQGFFAPTKGYLPPYKPHYFPQPRGLG